MNTNKRAFEKLGLWYGNYIDSLLRKKCFYRKSCYNLGSFILISHIMKLSDFNLPFGFKREWIKWGLIDHIIQSPSDDKELSDHEAFEIKLYLELHLLGLKQEMIVKVSHYFHRYARPMTIEKIRDADFQPSQLEDMVVQMQESGVVYILLIDTSGNIEVIQDELFFAVFNKNNYLARSSARITVDLNAILESLWMGFKRAKDSLMKKGIEKDFQKRLEWKQEKVTSHNPSLISVHDLMKKPNRKIVVCTNGIAAVSSIDEIEYLDWKKSQKE